MCEEEHEHQSKFCNAWNVTWDIFLVHKRYLFCQIWCFPCGVEDSSFHRHTKCELAYRYHRFGGACCPHLQVSARNIGQPENYNPRSLDCSEHDIASSLEMLPIHETWWPSRLAPWVSSYWNLTFFVILFVRAKYTILSIVGTYKGWIKSSGNSSIVLKWLYSLR